jgi:hypothetical protein
MLNRILCVVVMLCVGLWAPATLASSPSEPAFKSQLRSCFESGRPTEAIKNLQSWLNAGKSVYSSYQLAVSISMNCMRSVCGSQNGLCCNTYCSMYGLTDGERDNCYNKCYNAYSGG